MELPTAPLSQTVPARLANISTRALTSTGDDT
jgi:hypothetical protein